MLKAHTSFAVLHISLDKLKEMVSRLEIGLSLLAKGQLAPQIVPILSLVQIIQRINTELPKEWKITSEEIWKIYEEASVKAAFVSDRIRLFITIPIIDHSQRYTLYRILSLPRSIDGWHAIEILGLPDYLAISSDLENYKEI